MIKDNIEYNSDETSVTSSIKRSCQIQEQEMLVLSKQNFYVLSHVYKSMQKIEEAKKCLDRIEMYVDDQIKKDDKQFKEIMKRFSESETNENEPFTSLAGFALEGTLIGLDRIHKDFISTIYSLIISSLLQGPKKQDIAEIKARAASARKRAKYAEKMERLNLAYCRIMLGCQSTKVSDEEEKQTDSQFKAMVRLVKELDSSNARELESPSNTFTFPSKPGNVIDLIFSAARSIYTRRERVSGKEKSGNPYEMLFAVYGRGHDKHIVILLEFFNVLLVLAHNLRGVDEKSFVERVEKIDSQAIDIGKQLLSYIRQKLTKTSRDSGLINSTLFSNSDHSSEPNLTQTIKDSREYFSLALSIYYSSGKDYAVAVEWCDLLIEILLISQQFSRQNDREEIAHECSERVISEVIATKALSLSMTNCHGAALKAAREAYEKCGTEVGNVVTLFHCSVHYEVNSIQESSEYQTYDNTLFELDNAMSHFLATAKLVSPFEEAGLNKILDAFPVMFNTVTKLELDRFGPLQLGLQKRYVDLLVEYFSSMISKGEWNIHDVSISETTIPGNNNIFKVLCSYLTTFEKILTSSDHLPGTKLIVGQYQLLQKTLDSVLKLLVELRDVCNKSKDSLSQFSVSFEDIQESQDDEMLLFQKGNIAVYVGSNEDCLWIGKV